MVDPIADFLTRIRNAQMAGQSEVQVPYSKLKEQMARVMMKNKFLASVETQAVEGKVFKNLVLGLPEKTLTLKRVSKPGQRIYVGSQEVRRVLNGLGIAIVSTSKGVITGYEARVLGVGGELLCEVS
jgi:small subunit ribosomal protein S8